MSRPECRFFNRPGGCGRGEACRFVHTQGSPRSPFPSQHRYNVASWRSAPRANRTSEIEPVPQGFCRFHWQHLECKHGDSCRYHHVRGPDPASPETHDTPPPFLTNEGSLRLSIAGTDVFYSSDSQSPSMTINALKFSFLKDDFRFKHPQSVYRFLGLLTSPNSNDKTWSIEDGLSLLKTVAEDNGLLRLGDIIRWEPVGVGFAARDALEFQTGYIPLLKFYSSDFVLKSTLHHLVNALYMVLLNNIQAFCDTIAECMDPIIKSRSFYPVIKKPQSTIGCQFFISLVTVYFECLTRFKHALEVYPPLKPAIHSLNNWVDVWTGDIQSENPQFEDPFTNTTAKSQIIRHISDKLGRLMDIVRREDRRKRPIDPTSLPPPRSTSDGLLAALHMTYQGPGSLRKGGARHDNDKEDISEISIPPTRDELFCTFEPYLPAKLPGAPHHCPSGSMEELSDILFRLLREELLGPLRITTQCILGDMENQRQAATSRQIFETKSSTQFERLLAARGGKYRASAGDSDGVLSNLYTGVQLQTLHCDGRGLSVVLWMDSPPGRARSHNRATFWEAMKGKRLVQGSLVALMIDDGRTVDLELGLITSSFNDLKESIQGDAERLSIKVAFFEPDIGVRVLRATKEKRVLGMGRSAVLLESPILYEAIRPFLTALQGTPERIPFGRYLGLQPQGYLRGIDISPPGYATLPGFKFQLNSLFRTDTSLDMSVNDPDSVEVARQRLQGGTSRLDGSQADAVVDALTREVSLIQGPPGTGKSYTGVELIRVLLSNGIRPILLIAFTNHALDHLISSVLDASITSKIVRLGSRSADERISQYSLEALELADRASQVNYELRRRSRDAIKDLECELTGLIKDISVDKATPLEITRHLQGNWPSHFIDLFYPPIWVQSYRKLTQGDDGEVWVTVLKDGKHRADTSLYSFWMNGVDLQFLSFASAPKDHIPDTNDRATGNRFTALADAESSKNDRDALHALLDKDESSGLSGMSDSESEGEGMDPRFPADVHHLVANGNLTNPQAFFRAHGLAWIPTIPASSRSLAALLDEGIMWSLSQSERDALHAHWKKEVEDMLSLSDFGDFSRLQKSHSRALNEQNELRDEHHRELLRDVDIVGCTTTGAAKLTALLKSIGPRCMIVEEAGQVLEAHVLGSLVESIEHLILIGDPQQLRPTLNNYALSVDSKRGSQLYRFDESLMERLSSGGLPMSQLRVQRRMRPEISRLPSITLYPNLQDHELVTIYPNVRGFAKNVFFFSHQHAEVEEDTSKYNTFEVEIIKDLVLYLLRQGCYSQDGDIVVLCPYLGQLIRLRNALSTQVTVVIEGKDQTDLAEAEFNKDDSEDYHVEHVSVSKKVRLRTIDNYQGEEGRIVILSLVRNSGSSFETDKGRIGFLKSENRANVALSRAKEGLYILGNADQLASRSTFWAKIVRDLERRECIGTAIPVSCHQHPEIIRLVSEPGQLPSFAPDGGCLLPCNTRLPCGHVCPYKCHSDDPEHRAIFCAQPCRNLCPRGHPCVKVCSEACGECNFTISGVLLPCGHTSDHVPCYLLDDLDNFFCRVIVPKSLPFCEHERSMACSQDPSSNLCTEICDKVLSCCGRSCTARCSECHGESVIVTHREHPCNKPLYCGHLCPKPCSRDHECVTHCDQPCRQQCEHSQCKKSCSTACQPCKKECSWRCPHANCLVPCGSPCIRLPCDFSCDKILPCGHPCPSVCGEACNIQICPLCASEEVRRTVVDLVLMRDMHSVCVEKADGVEDLLITLPGCGHVFTVETLDGHCGLNDYYERQGDKWAGLRTPANSEIINRPLCPTCRVAITSPRYGRSFKSADLNTLEKNVVANTSQELLRISQAMSTISLSDLKNRLKLESMTLKETESPRMEHTRMVEKKWSTMIKKTRNEPLLEDALDLGSKTFLHVCTPASLTWKRIVQPLIKQYTAARAVAQKRSAHVTAWQASFSYLFEREMNSIAMDPTRAPRQPLQYAMRLARMQVGTPEPRADLRFVVEAFWITIQIRLTLAQLLILWVEYLVKNKTLSTEEQKAWRVYGRLLLLASLADSLLAYDIADKSESRKRATKTGLYILNAHLQSLEFEATMVNLSSKAANYTDRIQWTKKKDMIAAKCNAQFEKDQQYVRTLREDHLNRLPDDTSWLSKEFDPQWENLCTAWDALKRSLLDGSYRPVTLDERKAVIQAFGEEFTHTGHWYNCPNGHTFVIGECGGATQESICPECGSTIGGRYHQLNSSNSRATEFEDLSRSMGARPGPWSWNRDA